MSPSAAAPACTVATSACTERGGGVRSSGAWMRARASSVRAAAAHHAQLWIQHHAHQRKQGKARPVQVHRNAPEGRAHSGAVGQARGGAVRNCHCRSRSHCRRQRTRKCDAPGQRRSACGIWPGEVQKAHLLSSSCEVAARQERMRDITAAAVAIQPIANRFAVFSKFVQSRLDVALPRTSQTRDAALRTRRLHARPSVRHQCQWPTLQSRQKRLRPLRQRSLTSCSIRAGSWLPFCTTARACCCEPHAAASRCAGLMAPVSSPFIHCFSLLRAGADAQCAQDTAESSTLLSRCVCQSRPCPPPPARVRLSPPCRRLCLAQDLEFALQRPVDDQGEPVRDGRWRVARAAAAAAHERAAE